MCARGLLRKKVSAVLLRLAGASISILSLASCVWTHHSDYPKDWSPIATAAEPGHCPDLSGTYRAFSADANPCPAWEEACNWLSYNLLSGNIGWSEVKDESDRPAIPIGSHVRIQQSGDQRLDVSLLQEDAEQGWTVIGEYVLRAADADYKCEPEGLQLKSRSIFVPALIENAVGSVRRIFNRGEDGHLIMKREGDMVLHMGFFIHASDSIDWTRWEHIETSDSAAPVRGNEAD